MKKRLVFITFLMFAAMTTKAQIERDTTVPIEEQVKDAVARMTTHEKIQMLHAQSKFTSAGVPRLGIRQLNMDDGPHGVREELEWNSWTPARWTNDFCVAFPSLTCLAATWNRTLASAYGGAVSEEFAYRGKDLMLGPGTNIQRTPLNGRAFEYMGEDPLLAGEMVVPYIKAAQANGVGCCLKHFVLNDQETDRYGVNVNVSERAMREIYLRPFQKAVEQAHVWSIMGAYNRWNNVHCCQNDALLNGILKGEWGWDGAVVSDWNGTHDTMQAALGGLDIEMGTERSGDFGFDDYYMARPLEQLVEEGKVPMEVIDEKVSRVLRLIFRTAMNPQKVVGSLCSEAHYDVCRQVGEEGIVLLKNEKSILPIHATDYERILVVGDNATRSLTLGGGSSELKTLRDTSPLEALQACYGDKVVYAQGYTAGRTIYNQVDPVDPAQQAQLKAEALAQAKEADLVIFVGGMNKNHRQDCEDGDREGFGLSYGQDELIAELAQVQPNLVVVTFGGNPFAMPWLPKVKAMAHCWYLGSESGTALARVLDGQVCPSGRLPVTFAARYEDYPYVQFGKEAYPGVDRQVYYKEDLFVGYRHFVSHHVKPLFPFGYGLSYTTFAYGKPSAGLVGDTITIAVNVTNTGKAAGKEVVQVYCAAPKSELPRPARELKGFGKTGLLQPGESETLRIAIPKEELRHYDETLHGWVLAGGTYTFHVGSNVNDIHGKVQLNLQ